MSNRTLAIARATGVIGATAALIVGVTLAQLTTTATLTGNTLSSATGDLKVNNTDNGGSPAASDAGFSFSNLIPGSDYGTAKNFTLFNNGSATLGVTVYATLGVPSGSIDKTKVHFKFVNTDESSATQEYTLAELEALSRNMPGVSGTGSLTPTEEDHFTVQVKLDADAVTGSSGSVGSFDFVFTGTAVVPNPVSI